MQPDHLPTIVFLFLLYCLSVMCSFITLTTTLKQPAHHTHISPTQHTLNQTITHSQPNHHTTRTLHQLNTHSTKLLHTLNQIITPHAHFTNSTHTQPNHCTLSIKSSQFWVDRTCLRFLLSFHFCLSCLDRPPPP